MTKSATSDGASRFAGRWGKTRLLEALKTQTLVSGNTKLARAIVKSSVLEHHKTRSVLMRQGDPENDIFLIVAGEVSIRINGRHVADRGAGTHVGEMALADPLARRSATVIANEPTVTARLPEYRFSKIASKYPDLWRSVAAELAKRLRERSRQLRQRHNKPVLFIGSSTEGLGVTNDIYKRLSRKPIVLRPWSEGVFQASKTAIENLVTIAQEADFAVLVLTSDDVTISKGKAKPSPRDNVIFELGLFIGTLGRDRVFILKPKGLDVRIPSDLLGVIWLDYLRTGRRSSRTRIVCDKLWQSISTIGPR